MINTQSPSAIFTSKYFPYCLLFLIVFAAYSPALFGDFVYDDIAIVKYDPYIHNPHNILDILTLKILSRDMMDQNRPVNVLSTMIDSLFWGMNPFGYHLTNNLLHVIGALLLFAFIKSVLFDISKVRADAEKLRIPIYFASFLAALFFGLHPLNNEAISCVTYREDPLVNVCLLVSLLSARGIISSSMRIRVISFAASLFFAFLAAASKESGNIVPMVLLCYWFFIRNREFPKVWLSLIASVFFVDAVYYLAWKHFAFKGDSLVFWSQAHYIDNSFFKALLYEPSIAIFQLSHIIIPFGLSVVYEVHSFRHFPPLIAIPLLLAVIVGAIWYSIKDKNVRFMFLFIFFALLPTANLIPLFQVAADRFMYTPMIGVSILIAYLLYLLLSRFKPVGIISISLCILSFLSFLTYNREIVWQNSLNLWADAFKKNPYSWTAAENLGETYSSIGNYDQALQWFDYALRINNENPETLAGMAIVFEKQGNSALADSAYTHAIKADVRYKNMKKVLGSLAFSKSQTDTLDEIRNRISVK